MRSALEMFDHFRKLKDVWNNQMGLRMLAVKGCNQGVVNYSNVA